MLCAVELAEILCATGGEFITNRVTQFQSRTVRRKLWQLKTKSFCLFLLCYISMYTYTYICN